MCNNVVQSNHYYPFGMSFAEGSATSQQPYQYNGKELDTERGLNLYDYSARLMDPALGRFNTVDPMAEKYYSISPYVYGDNNPINAIDLTGELIIFINGFHLGDGGSRDYWDKNGGGFASAVEKHLGDNHSMFIDGSLGGALGAILGLSLDATNRHNTKLQEKGKQKILFYR